MAEYYQIMIADATAFWVAMTFYRGRVSVIDVAERYAQRPRVGYYLKVR